MYEELRHQKDGTAAGAWGTDADSEGAAMTVSDRVAESAGHAIVGGRTIPDAHSDVVESGRDGGLNRRRASGTTSARSLLMTILGEFALPGQAVVWTSSLVAAMAALDVEEKAARQAIARAAAEGLVDGERVGRRTRWTLSDKGRRLLHDGAARIYGFMRTQRRWNGNWFVVAVTVPETQRQLRHQLRTRLTWAGLGSPAPGLWVTPDDTVVGEVSTIMSDLDIGHSAMSWVGPLADIGDPLHVVRSAWQLQAVETAYHSFIADFARRSPAGGPAVFAAQVELVEAWRHFPFADPALPLELLDHEWPGPTAAATFHHCHDRWHRQAQDHWRQLCGDVP
jgi:phenylacetic acid degradation operon negative regulatory protein